MSEEWKPFHVFVSFVITQVREMSPSSGITKKRKKRHSANSPPRGHASEASVGRVAVPKDGQKNASPRGDATEALVGRDSVPKGRQMTSSPCRHTPEVLLGDGAVPKPIAGSEVSGSQGSRFSG